MLGNLSCWAHFRVQRELSGMAAPYRENPFGGLGF